MNSLKKFFTKLKSIKNIELYLALILAVIVIIFVFAGGGAKNASKSVSDDTYKSDMEHKICSVIQNIAGCGKADVVISYGSNDEGVVGVVVVAEGATDPIIRFKIVEVVVTLLDVDSSNVAVFTYKS